MLNYQGCSKFGANLANLWHLFIKVNVVISSKSTIFNGLSLYCKHLLPGARYVKFSNKLSYCLSQWSYIILIYSTSNEFLDGNAAFPWITIVKQYLANCVKRSSINSSSMEAKTILNIKSPHNIMYDTDSHVLISFYFIFLSNLLLRKPICFQH